MNKGLEALNEIREIVHGYNLPSIDKEANIIETELKRLEIIKNKEVNVFIFLHSGDLETYNDMVENNRKLIQAEFDLLKEVLL